MKHRKPVCRSQNNDPSFVKTCFERVAPAHLTPLQSAYFDRVGIVDEGLGPESSYRVRSISIGGPRILAENVILGRCPRTSPTPP